MPPDYPRVANLYFSPPLFEAGYMDLSSEIAIKGVLPNFYYQSYFIQQW